MKTLNGPAVHAVHVDYVNVRDMPGTNSVRLLFGERNEDGDLVYRAGVMLSIVNARTLANVINGLLAKIELAPQMVLPRQIEGVDEIRSGDIVVQLPKPNK